MMNRIRHNSPSPIQCLRAFHILFFAYLLFRCYCYNYYKTQKYYFCYRYRYFHITLLLNTLLQILSYPGVVELTTQLLILENILWLPLCRINKFGLNTLPSETVAIPILVGYQHACCRARSFFAHETKRASFAKRLGSCSFLQSSQKRSTTHRTTNHHQTPST